MPIRPHLLAAILFCTFGVSEAAAVCNISDAKLEEAILKKPEFRDQNHQMVQDLRALRDAAFVLGPMVGTKTANASSAISES